MALPRQYRGLCGNFALSLVATKGVAWLAWLGLAWPGLALAGFIWPGWLHSAWLDLYRVIWPGLIYRATADFRHRLPRYRPLRYTAYRATGGLR